MTDARGAPELAASQVIPETTVNEQARHIGAGAEYYPVTDKDLTAPPGSCADGARYIVAASPTGAWTGKATKIAIAMGANAGSGWIFANPVEGTTAYVQDEDARYLFDGSAWNFDATGGSVSNLDDLSDVDAASPSDGDVLTFNDGTGNWEPAAPAAGGGDLLSTNNLSDVADAATAGANIRPVESLVIACSDETTALTTGTAKVTFRMPYAFTVTAVRASVTTAPTGAALQVDINEAGASILSTVLSIDASEKTSTTAATAAVISDGSLADDAEMTIDIDQIGSTVAGAGLKIYLIGHRA